MAADRESDGVVLPEHSARMMIPSTHVLRRRAGPIRDLGARIHCRGNIDVVLRTLGDLGQASADTLLAALRDTTLSAQNRIESARIYREVLGRKLRSSRS